MVVNGFQPLTIFAKRSMLDVWQSFQYTSVNICLKTIFPRSFFVKVNLNSYLIFKHADILSNKVLWEMFAFVAMVGNNIAKKKIN